MRVFNNISSTSYLHHDVRSLLAIFHSEYTVFLVNQRLEAFVTICIMVGYFLHMTLVNVDSFLHHVRHDLFSQLAILNANYMAAKLHGHYNVVYRGREGLSAHEFILDLRPFKQTGIVEEDVAKRLQVKRVRVPSKKIDTCQ